MGYGQKRIRHRTGRVLVRFCYVMKNFLQRGSMGGEEEMGDAEGKDKTEEGTYGTVG